MLKSKWSAGFLGVLLVASSLNAENLYAADPDDSVNSADSADATAQSDLAREAFQIINSNADEADVWKSYRLRGFVTSNVDGVQKIAQLRGLISRGLRASEARDYNGNSLISALLKNATTCDPDPIEFLLREGVPTDPREHIGSTSVDKALLIANKEVKSDRDCSSELYMKTVSDCNREITLLMRAGSQFTGGDQLVKTCYDGNARTTTTTSYLNPGMISTSSTSSSSYSTPRGPSCKIYTVPGSPGITVCN